jgi:hypothetical protein
MVDRILLAVSAGLLTMMIVGFLVFTVQLFGPIGVLLDVTFVVAAAVGFWRTK